MEMYIVIVLFKRSFTQGIDSPQRNVDENHSLVNQIFDTQLHFYRNVYNSGIHSSPSCQQHVSAKCGCRLHYPVVRLLNIQEWFY